MTQKLQNIGIRLAIREEGHMLNAYLADENTMDGARLIASIAKGALEKDRELFERWKSILKDVLAAAITETTGAENVVMKEQTPREPRGGNA